MQKTSRLKNLEPANELRESGYSAKAEQQQAANKEPKNSSSVWKQRETVSRTTSESYAQRLRLNVSYNPVTSRYNCSIAAATNFSSPCHHPPVLHSLTPFIENAQPPRGQRYIAYLEVHSLAVASCCVLLFLYICSDIIDSTVESAVTFTKPYSTRSCGLPGRSPEPAGPQGSRPSARSK